MDTLKIHGLDKLMSKLNEFEQYDVVQAGLKKACERVEKSAKDKCPVDTGILQGSISHTIEFDKGIVGTKEEYGPYVELGTGKFAKNGYGKKHPWGYEDPKTGKTIWTAGQRPQPFLHPALTENAKAIQKDFEEEINKKLRRIRK